MSRQSEVPILTTTTNTYLLDRLKRSDNDNIWRQFVQRYRPMLVGYGRRLGLSDPEAEDAAQETLIRFATAHQEGKYDRRRGRLRSWLFTMANSQIRMTFRDRRRREVQASAPDSQTDFFARIPDDQSSEAAWEDEWRQAVLGQCLAEVRRQCDAKTIEAFELFAWKGWPARQVAEHLSMSENAVFLAKFRVLKQIKAMRPRMEEIW